ncbi:MAG: Lrp/AsnC family transcriptional regulator [Candidatus Omnitrophica bacterium]|nr:Lrp/AsnC family transcriptional regulator [Candidatus Omnitrophota bacterium]
MTGTATAPPALDAIDKKLLNLIQAEVPLVARPYAALAPRVGIGEAGLLERITRLKADGVIRQIGAIFDTRRMGYQSSLVATRIPPERLASGAAIISEHPGVSHNYGRNHFYNLWYTIALPPRVSMEHTVQRLHELSGAQRTRLMPTLRLFKIGVQLDVAGDSNPAEAMPAGAAWSWKTAPEAAVVTDAEVQAIRCLQEDLPVEPEPFATLAARWGLTTDALFARAASFQSRTMIRRYAAVLHHRSAGFVVNGMGVWKVPLERLEELGPVMGGFRGVSHCYQRPTYEDWPYTVFTMVHGRTGPEVHAVMAAIAQATGLTEHEILWSVKEYKKIRVKYFTPELDDWVQRYTETPSPVALSPGRGEGGVRGGGIG